MKQIKTHSSSNLNLKISLFLSVVYFVILWLGSIYSGSLSLGASAGHMMMHISVLSIAFIAAKIAEKSANDRFSAGYGRVESLGAFINSLLLMATAIFILGEIDEIHHDHGLHEIDSSLMSIIAVVGVILHSISAYLLYQSKSESLNIHAAFLHLFFDILITFATLLTALALHAGAPESLDKVVATLIAVTIFFSGARIFWMSVRQLMDATPHNINLDDIIKSLKEVEHVKDVHNVIVRGSGRNIALSAHIVLGNHCIHGGHWVECRQRAEDILREKFSISQTILQMEVDEQHAKDCEHHSHN